ncbi:MAG: hypothetical protein WAL70_10745 [Aeromicrobium sp.]
MHPPQIEAVSQPNGWALRLCRAAFAALVCTVLAAGAHAFGGGQASAAILLAFVCTWVVAAGLSARRLTTSQLVGLLLIGQVVVHLVSEPAGGVGSHTSMLVAHVVGTALSAWLLRHGEDALWTLAERIGLRVGIVTTVDPIAPSRPAAVLIRSVRTHRRTLLTHVIEGRGPPVGLA